MSRRCLRAALGLLLGVSGCSGSGDSGGPLIVKDALTSPNCTPVAGAFPSGLALSDSAPDRAALVQYNPPAVVILNLRDERPQTLAPQGIPSDSDSDGVDDAQRSVQAGFFPFTPLLGEIATAGGKLLLLSASNYEEILFVDEETGALVGLRVANAASGSAADPSHYPLLPPAGEVHVRSAVSTRACVFPQGAVDSGGEAVEPEAGCDPARPGFFSNLTAGKSIAAGHLFVATSNLRNSGDSRFYPGSVLVYDWLSDASGIRVQPDRENPVIATSGFNPTGVVTHHTHSGREVVLVTVTGAIGASTGARNVYSDAAVDVIDPLRLRVAARIPLGRAGPSFDRMAIDRGGRVGILGASSQRQLYAVDLAALEDPHLFEGDGDPVILDGLSAGFPDARIFHADAPLVLPDRSDGPPDLQCEGFTHAALNAAGSLILATDQCDGSLTRIRLDLSGSPPIPVPRARFEVLRMDEITAPLTPAGLGLIRAPGALRVRSGEPGLDFEGPDAFFLVGLPEAQVCALRVESPL
ncbi:MAG: hypothetical protein VCB99_05620 [Myxococcota bacterium]